MTHHRYDRRVLTRTEGFALGRSIDKVLGGHVLTYSLYRRDHRRVLHMHVQTFFAHEDRAVIAGHLRRAHRYLRDKVEDIDLVALGMAA
ncbi:hypothetical protein [Stenotrophomonas maltophilia]|uniref:hypothetical protein n=1 Tax=Stenotrophomonas maltophilia TaxID=40324 RepID=UPI0015DCFFF1|nr:hypothetical protein [Stenotrophomonas maltophilia]QDL27893.1 hypothetical protein EGM71_09095 [Stenotrophomonas maltophilia]